ncbi:hypothetical protein HDV06_005182 [Boothiomyces sp. JEL0866]|nr:hypothetical protein HDV06_005182 [Boothiomyces sp. JEL0866]
MFHNRIWRSFSNITKFTPRTPGKPKYFENRKKKLELKPMLYVGGGFIFFGGIYYVNHLEKVPISNRTRFMAVSEKQEIALGEDAFHQLKRQYHNAILPSNHPITILANKVSKSLIRVSGLSHLDWEVYVVDQNIKNAFVLPGGKIFVFTGILPVVKDEDGLAAVLGHEIAHQVARHAGEKVSWSVVMGIFGFLASLFFDAGAHTRLFTEFGIMMPFSRKYESEADYIGLHLMSKACYNPRAAVTLWENMKAAQTGRTLEFLSTHPNDDTRIDQIKKWLPEAEKVWHDSNCEHVNLV